MIYSGVSQLSFFDQLSSVLSFIMWKSYCGNKRLFLKLWSDLFDSCNTCLESSFKCCKFLWIREDSCDKKRFFEVWIVESQIPPFSFCHPEIHLNLPNIPWVKILFNTINDHLEMLHIILTLDFKPSFFSDKPIWWTSYELIVFNEWNLINSEHVFKFIDSSCKRFKFIPSCCVFIWIDFFWCWREWFSHHLNNVCFKPFSVVSDCLSIWSGHLSFSEVKPFLWLLFNVFVDFHMWKK